MAEGNNMQGEQITVSVCFNHLLILSDITVAYILSACVRSSLQFITQKTCRQHYCESNNLLFVRAIM